MTASQAQLTTIGNAIEEAFAYFDADGGALSEVERVKRFEAAKVLIAAQPELATGLLASEFETISFQRKSAAYRLIVGLDGEAIDAVKTLLGHAGEIARIWLVSILHYHDDNTRTGLMADLAKRKDSYPGHLAAMALVFQGRQQAVAPDELMLTLADALFSEMEIEMSAFFVADSALSCLRLLTGESFADTSLPPLHFYNFDHLLFSPPVHPFPYTSDRVSILSYRQRSELVDRVLAWWEHNRKTIDLRPLVSCFEQ